MGCSRPHAFDSKVLPNTYSSFNPKGPAPVLHRLASPSIPTLAPLKPPFGPEGRRLWKYPRALMQTYRRCADAHSGRGVRFAPTSPPLQGLEAQVRYGCSITSLNHSVNFLSLGLASCAPTWRVALVDAFRVLHHRPRTLFPVGFVTTTRFAPQKRMLLRQA